MNIVVVSPHRDDAAFSLGLSIDLWLASGHIVTVLNCFTQTSYAPFSDIETLHPNDRLSFATAVRRREDLAWNKLTNNKIRFHDLDLLDAPVRLGCSLDEVATVEIRPGDRAVARVAGAIRKLARAGSAQGSAFAIPLAVGGHIDHRVVQQAATEVFADQAYPVAFYEDLPYAAREGEADSLGARAAEAMAGLSPTFAGPPLANIRSAADRKVRIAECYDSQVDSTVVRSMAEFSVRYGGRERLWANPAWSAAGLGTPDQAAI